MFFWQENTPASRREATPLLGDRGTSSNYCICAVPKADPWTEPLAPRASVDEQTHLLDGDAEADEESGVRRGEMFFGLLSGMVPVEHKLALERVVFRTTRGKSLLHFSRTEHLFVDSLSVRSSLLRYNSCSADAGARVLSPQNAPLLLHTAGHTRAASV